MQGLLSAINRIRIAAPAYSAQFEIVALLGALGLIISMAVLPHLDAEAASWIFSHLE